MEGLLIALAISLTAVVNICTWSTDLFSRPPVIIGTLGGSSSDLYMRERERERERERLKYFYEQCW